MYTLIHPQQQTRLPLFFLIVALLLSAPTANAEVKARLSRNPVTIDESFHLIVESNSTSDNDPDFSVLAQDFQTVNQSQRQNIQMINGEVSRSTNWNLTLMARRTGRLTVPAISVGNDSTKPLTLLVENAAPPQAGLSGDDIFLKIEAKPEHAYQGQQILLNIQLYRAISTDNASLSQPEADDPDILIKKLGEDEQYETNIGKQRYLVVERRYALFTQKTGTLNLAPLVFQGEVINPGSRRNRLFGSPFSRFGSPGEIRRIESRQISLEIKPAVSRVSGEPWLPSSNLQLVENWGQKNGQFTVGEPVNRTLMLFADGLTSAQLPEIESALPEGLKQYPDQPLLRDRENPDGITGIREFKVAIVPSRSGRFTLPAININWWNVDTRRMETASIPQQQIEVLPAIGGEIQSAPVKDAVTSQPQQQAPTAISSNANTHYPWLQALTIFFGLGWIGTALAWRYNTERKPAANPIEAPIPGKSGKADMRVLRAACLANEPVAAGKALLEWGVSQWPDSPPGTIGSIVEKIGNPELKKQIAQLERSLYAETSSPWLGEALWQQLEMERGDGSGRSPIQAPIAPLYPD